MIPKGNPKPIKQLFLLPSYPLVTTNLCSVSIDSPILDIPCKGDPVVYGLCV
jgi:hypothetical protein